MRHRYIVFFYHVLIEEYILLYKEGISVLRDLTVFYGHINNLFYYNFDGKMRFSVVESFCGNLLR